MHPAKTGPGRHGDAAGPTALALRLRERSWSALAVGFVAFADMVGKAAPPLDPRADGIVVADRRRGADRRRARAAGRRPRPAAAYLRRQSCGRPRRHRRDGAGGPSPRAGLLRRSRPRQGHDRQRHLDRRVDGPSRASRSLIVVTSDYHMPRSMAELADAMPGVGLIDFPVSSPDLDLDGGGATRWCSTCSSANTPSTLLARAASSSPRGGQRTRPASEALPT